MHSSDNDTIRDIRNHKAIFSLGANSQKILKESLGTSVFADIESDHQALGILFNLYDEQSKYFRGFTTNTLQIAIESQNGLCIEILEGMRNAFITVDGVIDQAITDQTQKVAMRKKMIGLAVHLTVAIPLSIAGIPAGAFIEQLTGTTGASNFGNVPTVNGSGLDWGWAKDIDYWANIKAEYAGAFLKDTLDEAKGAIQECAESTLGRALGKLTGETALNSMSKARSSIHLLFDQLRYQVQKFNHQLKLNMVETLESKPFRKRMKEYVASDINALLTRLKSHEKSGSITNAQLLIKYDALSQAWIKRVMRSRTKQLRQYFLRKVNIEAVQNDEYANMLAKLCILHWIDESNTSSLSDASMDIIAETGLVGGLYSTDYDIYKGKGPRHGIPNTKSELRLVQKRKKLQTPHKADRVINAKKLSDPKYYPYNSRANLCAYFNDRKKETVSGSLVNALQSVERSTSRIDLWNAKLSWLGVIEYNDVTSSTKSEDYKVKSVNNVVPAGLLAGAKSAASSQLINKCIIKLLKLWINGGVTPDSTISPLRSAGLSTIPKVNEIQPTHRKAMDYFIMNIAGDGDCFFNSIIESLKAQHPEHALTRSSVRDLRSACATSYMQMSTDLQAFGYSTDSTHMNEVKRKIETAKQWNFSEFDVIVGIVMPQLIGMDLLFMHTEIDAQWVANGPDSSKLLAIAYNGIDHYSAVIPIDCDITGLDKGTGNSASQNMAKLSSNPISVMPGGTNASHK